MEHSKKTQDSALRRDSAFPGYVFPFLNDQARILTLAHVTIYKVLFLPWVSYPSEHFFKPYLPPIHLP